MKKTAKLVLTVGLLAVGMAEAHAQETVTNEFLVQNLNVALTGFAQGGEGDNLTAERVRISTRDLISATGEVNTRGAKLIVVTPTDDSGPSMFFVRTGSGRNTVDTDVSGLFTGQTLLLVESSRPNSAGVRRGTQYSIDQFQFGSAGTEEEPGTPVFFNVQGFSTSSLANQNLTSNVNGTGLVNGADAVLRGNIRISGRRIEMQVVEVPAE